MLVGDSDVTKVEAGPVCRWNVSILESRDGEVGHFGSKYVEDIDSRDAMTANASLRAVAVRR